MFLVRYNALSRVLETVLQKAQIPTRLVGGHKFFERLEVKDILAYLQLIDNPQYHASDHKSWTFAVADVTF